MVASVAFEWRAVKASASQVGPAVYQIPAESRELSHRRRC